MTKAGSGPPLLLIHAGIVDRCMWDYVMPAFAVSPRDPPRSPRLRRERRSRPASSPTAPTWWGSCGPWT